MTLDELRKKHKAEILRMAQACGVTEIRVFGSVARGEAAPGSDIDLLVHPPQGIGIECIRLERQLTERLNIPVQLISVNALHPLLRTKILSEAVPL